MRTSLSTRLSLWMIAVVVGALTLAGLGAIVLQDRSTIRDERNHLSAQAQTIASSLDTLQKANALAAVSKIAGITGVTLVPYDDAGDILVGQTIGKTTVSLPPGLDVRQFPPTEVASGASFSGRVGKTLYAAVASSDSTLFTTCNTGYTYDPLDKLCIRDGTTLRMLRAARTAATTTAPIIENPGNACADVPCAGALVVLTSPVDVSKGIVGYFLLASAVALLLAVVVALTIARRISRPLRRAVETTRQIASGDLDVHVDRGERAYPELASLSESLDTMSHELREARDLQRNFLLSVSHELRTPLTSIRGYAEAISDGAADDPARAAEVIASESRRLERLVADLLDLAKLSAHAFSLNLARVDVGQIAVTAADALRPMLATEGIALQTHLATDGPLEVSADPDRLSQVFSNLLENAYKYARSTVHLVAGQRDGWIVVGIEDDGPGIPPEDLPHVFDRLFSSQRVAARRAGTGLGLTIVSELLHAMGGTVRADSPIGPHGGTRMVVTLRPSSGPHASAPGWPQAHGAASPMDPASPIGGGPAAPAPERSQTQVPSRS